MACQVVEKGVHLVSKADTLGHIGIRMHRFEFITVATMAVLLEM